MNKTEINQQHDKQHTTFRNSLVSRLRISQDIKLKQIRQENKSKLFASIQTTIYKDHECNKEEKKFSTPLDTCNKALRTYYIYHFDSIHTGSATRTKDSDSIEYNTKLHTLY